MSNEGNAPLEYSTRTELMDKVYEGAEIVVSRGQGSKGTILSICLLLYIATMYSYAMSLIFHKSVTFLLIIFLLSLVLYHSAILLGILHHFRRSIPFSIESYLPSFTVIINLVALFFSIIMGLFLIARVLNGRCDHFDQLHMWSCNSEYDAHALPQEVVIGLMFLPVVFLALFKIIRFEVVQGIWIVSVSSITVAMVIGGTYQSLPALVLYVPLSIVVLYELHYQNTSQSMMLKKQRSLLELNKRLAEEAQNELRFMIANMAHDLKTPLSAFLNAIESQQCLVAELDSTFSADCVSAIKDNLNNLSTVNAFMTMTVNRCIDYMKASKGIKLEPRLETINLQEVLSMPLNCMRDLQSRIAIMQKPIPGSVCSHIITDLQWFQENLFCLISNAVKYSCGGVVTVCVSLTNECHSSIVAAKLKKRLSVRSYHSGECVMSHHSAAAAEAYSFLDRFVRSPVQKPGDSSAVPKNALDIEMGATPSGTVRYDSFHNWSSETALQKYRKSLKQKHVNKSKVHVDAAESAEARVTPEEELILIEVEDTGIGLSDEAKEKLFSPFKQAQRRAGGTGLGLYSLAKRVDALGGYYGVSNRRDGEQGSIFWFAIPYQPWRTSIRASPLSVASERTVPERISPALTDLARNNEGVLSKLRVLLVDDSLTILKMTSNLLKRHGHVVDQEENGADALKALERNRSSGVPYDIVLMDLNMPVMDGLEAMKRLRETERQLNNASVAGSGDGSVLYHQKVFAFSANSDNETMQEAMECGADDFISKPFSVNTFNEKVDRVVRGVH